MVSILNVKLIRQRFADFFTKLKIWRQSDRVRKRRKKHFDRNYQRLVEALEYQSQTFQNDVQVVNDCNQIYNDFQVYLRKSYKNEKTLNNFLAGLPEAQPSFKPDDLNLLITRAEQAHATKTDLYSSFIGMVKNECVMNVHFFAFTSLPEMIVRKNYTRKQYETLRKLLVTVKEQYLEQRSKQEEIDDD